ncbi:hypothetical protein ABH931_007305 [Streptacidiphilus sp. MAP12-33]
MTVRAARALPWAVLVCLAVVLHHELVSGGPGAVSASTAHLV